ncbi:MAG: TolC family protein, partial [Candidatus Latescibacterota bacterium]|nr:TolC family protein [Candidatus Latescibacterota bacterium]
MRVVPLLVFSLSAVSAQDSVLEIWQREQVRGAGRSALRPLVNLQDYVYYSQLYNSDIEAALWGWKAAIDDVKTARSWSDPHVALGHFLRPIETRDGPQQQRFSVAQAIPWPSELDARSRVALAVADAERWRYEERRADVALRVIEAYLDCYYLERAIEITERSMQLV